MSNAVFLNPCACLHSDYLLYNRIMRTALPADQIEILAKASQAGSEDSFSKLFNALYEKIFRYISFKVKPEEVEDLVSDVFLKVVTKLQSYKLPAHKKTGFTAWVFRIAHNTVVDHYRTQRHLLRLDDDTYSDTPFDIPDKAPLPDEELQKEFESVRIRSVLEKLSPLHREVLELKYLEDFSNTEIAHITGKKEGNIRIIQMRALREMKKELEITDL